MGEAFQPVILSGASQRAKVEAKRSRRTSNYSVGAKAVAGRSGDAPFHDNALPTHRLRPQKLEVLRLRFARLSASAPLRMTGFFLAALAFSARAQTPDKPNYSDHVLPIFRNACLNCHNPDKKKAGLDLSTYQGALQGSENGKVVRSGDGSGSLLLKCVLQTEDPKMPPKGDKLSDGEIAIVRKWIDSQLLETAGGKAVAVTANNVQVAVVSLTRPEGPAPMPRELPLDPVVHTAKANSLTALGASPWAPLVALGGQKQIVLFNTETLEPLGVLPFPEGFPTIIRFSRNGQLILTGGGRGGKSGKVVIWKVETGERIAAVGQEFDQVLAADLSADQQFVALGGPAKLVKIYATKDGRLVHSIKKHTDWVTALSFSPDGKLLASGDRNGGVIVWEAAKGKEFNVLAGHKGAVTGVSFMTGVVASASEDATIKLWDANLGREIKSWSGHKGGVQSVAFSPDGRLVSSGRDKIVRVWDQAGKQLMASEAFGDIALRAELAGERVIGGDWSGQVRVWSLSGKRVGELSANPPTLAERIAAAAKQLAEAQAGAADLQKQLASAEEKQKADIAVREEKLKAERAAEEAKLKTELGQAEAALAKARAEQPEKVAALEKAVQEVTARIAALPKPPLTPPAGAAESPTAQEIAKAKSAVEQSQARIAAVQTELEKWRAAEVLQGVHNARQLLADKQAAYETSLQAAKDAPLAIERARSELAAAQKTTAEAPAKLKEKEALFAQAQQEMAAKQTAVEAAHTSVKEMEAALKALTLTPKSGSAPNTDLLAKNLAGLTAEIARLREARGKFASGTSEYAEADAKVQAIKPSLAAAEAARETARAGVVTPSAAETKAAQAEVHKAREALKITLAAAKPAAAQLAAADKALTAFRKETEAAAQLAAKLRKELPGIEKTARATQAEAERAAKSAAREVQAAKAEAEKRRATYESLKAGGRLTRG
jgi:hypothetical protein